MIPRINVNEEIFIPSHPLVEAQAFIEDCDRIQHFSLMVDSERVSFKSVRQVHLVDLEKMGKTFLKKLLIRTSIGMVLGIITGLFLFKVFQEVSLQGF